MTRDGLSVCVMGSSHSAAVVTAWRQRAFPVEDNVSLTFFASHALSLKDLEIEGRSLVPSKEEVRNKILYTSGGKDRIDVDDYDIFVTIALGFGIVLGDIAGEYGPMEHLAWGAVPNLLSRACFEETLRAKFEDSLYLNITDKIRKLRPTVPVLNVPKPCPPETALDEPPLDGKPQLRDPAYLEKQFALCKRMAEETSTAHGAEVLWPPAGVLAVPGFTKREYAQNAVTLTTAKRARRQKEKGEDGKHMNADYGHVVLDAILAKLDAMSGGRMLKKPRSEVAAE